MTTIESTSSTGNGCTAGKDSAQRLFIASKTVANVLAEVKPLPYRQLVDLPSTATMEEAFDVFLAEDILSAPVYRLVGGRKEYITIVSVLDLLKLLGSHTDEQSNALLKPLSEAIGLTEESSHLVTVKPSDPLEYVMDLFSRLGAHRVLVQGEEQPVLLSQMDVARYLQAQNHHLGHILDITTPTIVERARARQGLPLDAPVSSITFKSTAMEAFLKIANHRQYISALCILDDDNTMVSDLSPENLRGLNRDRFDSLQKPVIMYLKECDGELYPPLSCHDRFTLSQIMTAFVLRKVHRLWWCDNEGHVKGVITLSDLLGTFIDSTL